MTMLDEYMKFCSILQNYRSSNSIIKKIYYNFKLKAIKSSIINKIKNKSVFNVEDLRNFAWVINNELALKKNILPDYISIISITNTEINENGVIYKYDNNDFSFTLKCFNDNIDIIILSKDNIKNEIGLNISEKSIPGKNPITEFIFKIILETVTYSINKALIMEIGGQYHG